MARPLTVISLLLQSTTHCRYRVYTKFLLTYTAIYRGNRKVLPLGITALQPQSHFHLGTPYTIKVTCTPIHWQMRHIIKVKLSHYRPGQAILCHLLTELLMTDFIFVTHHILKYVKETALSSQLNQPTRCNNFSSLLLVI